MVSLTEVAIEARTPEQLHALVGPERAAHVDATARVTRAAMEGRAVINVSSTAKGGGVAEMLQTLLAYARGVGVDTRWFVIGGTPAFFAATKRVHNNLYASAGDGGPLGRGEHEVYEATLQPAADDLLGVVQPGDVVLLHDPQTAGLAGPLRQAGAYVVWWCHSGVDVPDEHVARAWDWLARHLEDVDTFVFSRRAFAPLWVDDDALVVIAPSIDSFSTKNLDMAPDEAERILRYVGLVAGDDHVPPAPFTRRDGSPGRVDRHVDILQTGPPPPGDVPLAVQVSRWDLLKDMAGVMVGFAEHVATATDAHLVLAGPR